jgi:phosphoenolpyruvate phosphomutase
MSGEGARRLRELLAGPEIVRLMGAHNPLGALVAQRAGFHGIWSSGLELAVSRGLPDAGVIAMGDQLAAAASMTRAVPVPILADCDTGFGDMPGTMRAFEAAGIAGICIEDKRGPKLNSFAAGPQELVSIEEFAHAIARAKATQRTADFVLVARVEALVAGHRPEDALARAEAYADAGADAILLHSKERRPHKLFDVIRRWDGRAELAVVPTTYYTTSASELQRLGVRVVIYANQGLRSALRAMERTCAEILRTGSSSSVEPQIASVASVLDMSGTSAVARIRSAQAGGHDGLRAAP